MKLGILMDAIEHIKAYKDSTVAMIKSAQKLGWACSYFTTEGLFCHDGHAFARAFPIKIKDETNNDWAEIGTPENVPLTYFDIILMRKDPPFNMEYIYATYVLDLAEKEGVLIANKPQSLRDANEKFFTLQFPQCCPATLVSKDISHLRDFWETHRNVIFKPLQGMGGESIFQVSTDARNLSVILEVLTQKGSVTIMAQKFIPEIATLGDKRIILIDGEPIEYALARIPSPGELRGNLAAGATGKIVPLSDQDKWICAQLAESFKAKGLYFVGIDVIGEYLTEINVTSPTGICEITKESGLDIATEYLDVLQRKINSY